MKWWRRLSLARKVIYIGYLPIIALGVIFLTTGIALTQVLVATIIVFAVAAIVIAVIEERRKRAVSDTDDPDH